MAFSEIHNLAAEPSNEQECYAAAEKLLRQGHPLLAYDAIRRAGEHADSSIRLKQLLALALARSGAAEEARRVAFSLFEGGARDEETLGIIARSEKDLARVARTGQESREHLEQSFRAYEMAYRQTGGYWSGINAATVAMHLGNCEFALNTAKAVREQCHEQLAALPAQSPARYWIYPTLGEAALILGNIAEAEDCYGRTVEGAAGDWGSLRSVRQNARLLTTHVPEVLARLEAIFNFPRVITFSGHMFDQPGRGNTRFPTTHQEAVRGRIRSQIEQLNGLIGFGSAACGSDILFHEELQAMGGESHVILPFRQVDFLSASASMVGESERLQRVVDAAADVFEATNAARAVDGSYEYTNLLLHGAADLRCREIETELVGLAVWDGQEGDGPGGTESCIRHWRQNNVRVVTIRLDEITEPVYTVQKTFPVTGTQRPASDVEEPTFPMEIRSLLFADVVGFSKLSDEQIPFFVKNFLGMVSDLTNSLPWKPLMKNTWGDGIYLVFDDVEGAGNFALELKDTVQSTDWSTWDLPPLQIRIGLHAGPVYSCVDPLTQNRSYIGAHVSRAARIEPITPPGQVYCSQAFAALAAAQGARDFVCDYVGRTSLAKDFGTYPTYVAHRCGIGCVAVLL